MTPDYTDLIASIRLHMQQTELITHEDIRVTVWAALYHAWKAAERAQQAIAEQSARDAAQNTPQATITD